MINQVFIVEVSPNPFAKIAPIPTRYKFPSERRAMKFASMSIGQGHYVTIHIEDLPPYEGMPV